MRPEALLPARPPSTLLVVLVAAAPAAALALTGAVGAGERAVLAGLVGLALLGVALRGDVDARVGRLALAGIPPALAVAVGLVPLPRGALQAVAPGIAAARPHDPAWTLSLRPDATAVALATWCALVGLAVAAGAVGGRREAWARGLAWATVAWAAVGVGHALAGADHLLGVLPVRDGLGLYLAPLINPNHHGTVLVAGLPFVVAELRRCGRGRPPAAAALGATALWAVALPLVIASMGVLLALGALAVAATATSPRPRRVRLGATAAVVLAGLAGLVAVVTLQPEWADLSAGPRVTQWRDTWALVRDHPLAGVGAGGYAHAYPPYRTVARFEVFDHVHADPLELLATTGILGVLAAVAAWALRPRARGDDLRPWTLALVAVGAHAVVDFPLHVPGVAALVALLVGLRQAGGPPGRRIGAGPLVALAALQAVALAVLARQAVIDRAVDEVRAAPTPAAVERLASLAPWRPEPALARLEARYAPEEARAAAARFADHGPTLARLAGLAWRAGDRDDARAWLHRSVTREPNDPRAWRMVAALRQADGDPAGAAEAWSRVLRLWPRDPSTEQGVFDAAWATLPVGVWWIQALDGAPAHFSLRLARRLLADGEPETALLACEQAARLRPHVLRWNGPCAEALVALGRHDDALAYLRAWTAAHPWEPDAWASAARLGRGLGAEARVLWQEALVELWGLLPGEPVACALLDDALAQACATRPGDLLPATCALVAVAREGRQAPGAAWLARRPAFADDAAWRMCPERARASADP